MEAELTLVTACCTLSNVDELCVFTAILLLCLFHMVMLWSPSILPCLYSVQPPVAWEQPGHP